MFDIITTDVRSRQALWRDFLMPCWKDMADAEDDTRPYNLFFWASMPYWSRTLGISSYLACNALVFWFG